MLDLADIPAGMRALDALVKEAVVQIHAAGTVQRGHYLILFGGEVEPVQRAFDRALGVAADDIYDLVLLPHAEERIAPAIANAAIRWPAPGDTLGVIQTGAPPTLVRAVDRALKGALVELIELRVAEGLGGKSIATLWGETHDVEAAISHANQGIAQGLLDRSSTTVIRNADDELINAVRHGTRFFQEFRG
jgi:microcompartment protein CcmL/EutN